MDLSHIGNMESISPNGIIKIHDLHYESHALVNMSEFGYYG